MGIDIGGTFTDTVVIDGDGGVSTYKAPTTPDALLEGLESNLREAAGEQPLDGFLDGVERIAHGTTAATNAFLERRGARVALLTTRGFEDTIFMQRQLGMTAGLSPTELTDYSLRRVPEPLAPRALVFGVRERVDYRGETIGPLREEDVDAAAAAIEAAGVEAVAICFLWSFANPRHERRAAEIVQARLPGLYVSLSCDLAPRLGEYERTATTLVNAYLGPVISRYTDALQRRLGDRNLLLLDSGGSVMSAREAGRAPARLLLSGPSGGVTASQFLGEALGHRNVITFDMGGTSTDVGLIVDGEPLRRVETEIGKYHLLLPMVDIRAIGAGGGSVARVEEGGYLRVGPQSAGAVPGPACYGAGGALPTVTDADLLLGILDPDHFLGGRITLARRAAHQAVQEHVAGPLGISVEQAAAGIKRIVDGRMADLLRTVTLERGHDPREFTLYAFGGAGPAHAPAFALELADAVVVPVTQSVHSALGAASSDLALRAELSSPMRLARDQLGADVDADEIARLFAELEQRAGEQLAAQGIPADHQSLERAVEVRFVRQTKALEVPYREPPQTLVRDFLGVYAGRYGETAVPELAGFEFVTFVVSARGWLRRPRLRRARAAGGLASVPRRSERSVYDPIAGEFLPTPVYVGEGLQAGHQIDGPAVIQYATTTLALCSGQRAQVGELLAVEIRSAA
ncbi:MAG: hydantoinase/oxoprolinase family protein [Solirubrobacteraceae bacterium]